jgi:hypothetical protein
MTRRHRGASWRRGLVVAAAVPALWLVVSALLAPPRALAPPPTGRAEKAAATPARTVLVAAPDQEPFAAVREVRDLRDLDSERRAAPLEETLRTVENGAVWVEGVDRGLPPEARPRRIDLTERPKSPPSKR